MAEIPGHAPNGVAVMGGIDRRAVNGKATGRQLTSARTVTPARIQSAGGVVGECCEDVHLVVTFSETDRDTLGDRRAQFPARTTG